MKLKQLTVSLISASLVLSGCAGIQQRTGMDDKTASTVGGAAIGCAAGVLIARIAGTNAKDTCAAGAVVGGLIGFEKARQAEIAAAEQARKDAIAALSTLPPAQSKAVIVSPVRTVEVTATDKATKQTRKYAAFDSVTVQMPATAKATPEYDAAVGKLKTLAERVADERGSSEIIIAVNGTDAKMQKIVLESNSVKTANGGTVTVTKRVDVSLVQGIQTMTVRAGNLRTDV